MEQDAVMMQALKNFQRQFPREAQKAKSEIQRVIAEGGAPGPDEIADLLKIATALQTNPSMWAQFRPELVSAGMPEEMLPPPNASKEQLAKIIGLLFMTVYLLGQGPGGEAAPPEAQPVQPTQGAGLINAGVAL